MTDTPESVNLSDVSSRKVDTELLNELRDLFARAEDQKERYDFTWNGKAKAYFEAATPTTKTLRPQPEESYIYADDDYKEKVNTFNDSENLFITGDNLEALKLLQESYLGKIDMIYIDPPYNTGKDFVYHDNFKSTQKDTDVAEGSVDEDGNRLVKNEKNSGRYHSDWLSMMYPRLKLARNLLSDSGVIFVSIDDNEQANLKLLMDEVFGEANFVADVIVNKASEIATGNIIQKHEAVFVYAKNNMLFEVNGISKYSISRGTVGNTNQTMPVIDFPAGIKAYGVPDGIYENTRKIAGSSENIENMSPIVIKNGLLARNVKLKAKWRSSNDMRNYFNNDMKPTKAKINGIIEEIYFENDRFNPQIKKATSEKIPDLYLENDRGSKYIEELGLKSMFENPKSVKTIKYLISLITRKKNLVVLDFFGGIGTTAQAVVQLNKEDGGNRKFIVATLDEPTPEDSEARKAGYQTIDQISRERIRRAAKKLGDTSGFRALKVDKTGLKEDVFKTAGELTQENLQLDVDNQADSRSDYELLYDVLVDGALEYNRQIATETISNEPIIKYDYLGELSGVIAYCGDNLTNELTREIAKLKPLIAVFKESTFNKSSDKVNVLEQFRVISPETKVKVI